MRTDPRLHAVAVCVPVRNEQDHLPAFLRSCAALDVANVELRLCLHLDGCSDRSEAIVRAIGPTLPFPVTFNSAASAPTPNAGRARRAAMTLGLKALAASPDGVLLSTDADSQPRPDWIPAAVRALSLADVAAGRILRLEGAPDVEQARLERYYDRLHAHRRSIDPVAWDPGGCHYTGGANMGVRASAYRALGGFPSLASGEDAAFLDHASRAGFRVRHDPAMTVYTSSRRDGRAPNGLATLLADLDAHGLPMVVHPAAADWQYRAHAVARQTFARLAHEPSRARLGALLGITGDHVLGVGRDCTNAEAFCMQIVPASAHADWMVSLGEAEDALTELEQSRGVRAA